MRSHENRVSGPRQFLDSRGLDRRGLVGTVVLCWLVLGGCNKGEDLVVIRPLSLEPAESTVVAANIGDGGSRPIEPRATTPVKPAATPTPRLPPVEPKPKPNTPPDAGSPPPAEPADAAVQTVNPPDPLAVVGRACGRSSECGKGLECWRATPDKPGPAGGYCTAPCTNNNDLRCQALDPGSRCDPYARYCLRECLSKNPLNPEENKCLGRGTVVCASPSWDQNVLPPLEREVGVCMPLCGSDLDCEPGYHCTDGMCGSQAWPGKAMGEKCAGAVECAGGVCLGVGAFCSGFCRVGSVGCGYDVTSPHIEAACLEPAQYNEGLGDVGLCYALCKTTSDCKEPSFICRRFGSGSIDGKAGRCVPKPEDVQAIAPSSALAMPLTEPPL
jgi:hypothetical protein